MKDTVHAVCPFSLPAPVRGSNAWPPAMRLSPPGFSLSDGWDLSGLTLSELWLRYLAVGGSASQARVAEYARGQLRPDSHEHNMIAQAINEFLRDQGEGHPVCYQGLPLLP
jgi:hypothetical protein